MDIRYNFFNKLKNILNKNYILLILLIATPLILIEITFKNKELKKIEEENKLNIDKIENCIDIENKNKRTIYENIKLSEYCIDNFGIIKLSQ